MILNGLRTERLEFRELLEEDARPMLGYFQDAEATRFRDPIEGDLYEFSLKWVRRQRARYREFQTGLAALTLQEDGRFIGVCGLIWQEVNGQKELEIGYHLLPQYWKQGFATEAARACKQFAGEQKLAPSVCSLIDIPNDRSIAVAVRNDMHLERKARWRDKEVYLYRWHF